MSGTPNRGGFLAVLVMVLGVAAIVCVFVFKADFVATPKPQGEGKPPSKESPPVVKDASQPPPAAPEPRRVPVAGQDGYFVVFMPDGTSYLEAPDGKKTQLVDAAFASRPDPDRLAARLAAKLAPKDGDKRREPGQLIVLDEGVVDVPKGAQITLIEKDRLVVMNGDGSSTVYYADGKTELREKRKAPQKGRKDE